MKIDLTLKEKMVFEGQCREHRFSMDASKTHGGDEQAPSPKEFLLSAMAGCTAMDVLSILRKMRIEPTSFRVEITGVLNDQFPIHFVSTELIFHINGDVAEKKAVKAITASLTKYCGVNYMASKTCDITYQLFINGDDLGKGKANFN